MNYTIFIIRDGGLVEWAGNDPTLEGAISALEQLFANISDDDSNPIIHGYVQPTVYWLSEPDA